jgi:long-chain acyl-CoA synthetase
MDYSYLVNRTVRRHGPRTAITVGDTTRSYDEIVDRGRRLGNALAAHGIAKGDRVGVLLGNCAEYMEIDIGLAEFGYVRVSLNTRATAKQQVEVLKDARPRVLIYGEDFSTRVASLRQSIDVELAITIGSHDGPGIDYEHLLGRAPNAPPSASPRSDDLYCLFYTSGTTGRPKGVMLTHRAYVSVALSLLLEFGPVKPGDAIVLTQPLSHGGGFFMLPWFLCGGHCVVMPRFDAGKTLELVARHAAKVLKVVPTMLLQILSSGAYRDDLASLRQVIYGASPMPAARMAELLDRFGPVFVQLYGQAEAPMCITVLPREDHVRDQGRLLSSAGRPWLNAEVRVVDDNGRDLGVGEVGEVIVRGSHLMAGYWEQPGLTNEVLIDGYVHTRDMASVDDEGYVTLLGRSDEMIISGGFNVAPRSVESILNGHPAVHESFVMGLPHETLGQEVTAFVALRAGQHVTPDDLIAYAREELAYEKPRSIWIVPQLPRNAYGKVVKSELRAIVESAVGAS